MRPGQHNNNNNKRNRNRNRRHSGGGNGQGGGNGANRVYDSNGPDVKLRGTAQTVAEKYMQLARDAQSSGDSVMAESYYQFADHYYRVWLAAQPAGQPIQFSRRMAEEEYDEEGADQPAAENEADGGDGEGGENPEAGEANVADGAEASGDDEAAAPFNPHRQQNRSGRDNQQGQGNNRFRQRWPRRGDRFGGDNAAPQAEGSTEAGDRVERQVDDVMPAPREVAANDSANWEAPSFLKRPMPAVSAEAEPAGPRDDQPAPRPRGRRPRVAAPVDEVPQGE